MSLLFLQVVSTTLFLNTFNFVPLNNSDEVYFNAHLGSVSLFLEENAPHIIGLKFEKPVTSISDKEAYELWQCVQRFLSSLPFAAQVKQLYIMTDGDGMVPVSKLIRTNPSVIEKAVQTYTKSKQAQLDKRSLEGKHIAVSAGHGYHFDEDIGAWTFQRGINCDYLREDIHNAQWVFRHLIPMLSRVGATILPLREPSFAEAKLIVDNQQSGYNETGLWETQWTGYNGASRLGLFDGHEEIEASWQVQVPYDGLYSLFYFTRHDPGYASQIPLMVAYAGGVDIVQLDQSATVKTDNQGFWQLIGLYQFLGGVTYTITISSDQVSPGKYIYADAIRIGGGYGNAVYNNTNSGRMHWEESAKPFLKSLQVPTWIETENDVTIRPIYATYAGVDAVLSIHTNAGRASGTETYVWADRWPPGEACNADRPNTLPPGTLDWQADIHQHVIDAIQLYWNADWPDRGMKGCNFGELRPLWEAWVSDPLVAIPGALIEIAFHDNCLVDSYYIGRRKFRHDVSRAIVKGMIDYFHPLQTPLYPPLPPKNVSAVGRDHSVILEWGEALDELDPMQAQADLFKIYYSSDGIVFLEDPIMSTAETRAAIAVDNCRAHYFKITAVNEAGESLDSEIVGVYTADNGGYNVLLVDGVDRLAQGEADPNYPRLFTRQYMQSLEELDVPLQMDTVCDENVEEVLSEKNYHVVIWYTGESSRLDNSITTSQQLVIKHYLAQGGKLLLSGSEILWDLVEYGSSEDRQFVQDQLLVNFEMDDSQSNEVLGMQQYGFQDDPMITFGTGQQHSYLVEFPDAVSPIDPAKAVLQYANGLGYAATAYQADDSDAATKLIFVGFPLESIYEHEELTAFLQTAFYFFFSTMPEDLQCTNQPSESGDDDQSSGQDEYTGDTLQVGRGCGCQHTSVNQFWVLLLILYLYLRMKKNYQ